MKKILFPAEMVGAVRGIDPETGHYYDDTKRYVDAVTGLDDREKTRIFQENARAMFKRLGTKRG